MAITRTSIKKRLLRGILITVLVVISLSCVGVIIWFYDLDAPNLEKDVHKAEPLLTAIKTFNQETGQLPVNLQRLMPDNITEIPKAGWRYEFVYSLSEDHQRFALIFKTQGVDGQYFYCSKYNSWNYKDSGEGILISCLDN